MLAYACVLDVDRGLVRLVRYVARLLRAERRRIGTRRGTRESHRSVVVAERGYERPYGDRIRILS
jgi:hypothetical protein